MPTAANPASPRPSTARHEMLPRQVCQASSSTAGVSAITPPKSVPQPGTPSTITPAPPTASTASAPAVRDLRVNRPPAAAAVTSVAVANAPNVEFPNPKNRPPVTGPSANMLPTCSGVLSTPSTSSTTYAAATTPSTARQFRTRYDAVATAALIASVTRYRLRPGSGQRHHCVRVLRYTALKNPPCASIVATNTRRDRRVCRSLYQASASSCAARIVSPTATSMTSGCANRSLVSSRSRITAAVSVCTSPPACTWLPSSGASGALSDSRVAVRSVSWISPGRRVVLLVSQRGPSSGGSCIATSVSRCAPAISSPTPASTTHRPCPRACSTSCATRRRASSRPSRNGIAPASTTASLHWASNCGSNSGHHAAPPSAAPAPACVRTEPSGRATATAPPGPNPHNLLPRAPNRPSSASVWCSACRSPYDDHPATRPPSTAGSSGHGRPGSLPQARVPALIVSHPSIGQVCPPDVFTEIDPTFASPTSALNSGDASTSAHRNPGTPMTTTSAINPPGRPPPAAAIPARPVANQPPPTVVPGKGAPCRGFVSASALPARGDPRLGEDAKARLAAEVSAAATSRPATAARETRPGLQRLVTGSGGGRGGFAGRLGLGGLRRGDGLDHRGEEGEAVGARAGQRLDAVLRVRHQADHVAGLVADAGDVAVGAVRVAVDVARDHPALALEQVQRVLVRDETAVLVLQHDGDLLAGVVRVGPGGGVVLDPEPLVLADELAVVVLDQRAGQQVRLAQHLEAVADAEHREAAASAVDDLLHHRREPRDRTRAQVVAVREPARQHHRVDPVQVGVAMPQRDRLGTGDGCRTTGVDVVQRAREGDDPDLHWTSPDSMCTSKSSITGFASSVWAALRICATRSSVASPSRVISNRLPCRTSATPSKPSRPNAPCTALPCGSRISGLSMTSTTTRATEQLLVRRNGGTAGF